MKKEQILIVEDERLVATDIKVCLKRLGYEVAGVAYSGEAAIKKAGELKPDLVLMDIVLEGKINGIDAAAKIRSRFNIPVVYLTAYSDIITVERAKIAEPYGYILKPFEDRDLHSTIEMALYKHTMENMLRESEAFNFALFQYNPIETIAVDHEGKVKKINMAQRKSGDRLPNLGDVMYKDYAGKHEIDIHAELMTCIKKGKKKGFPELKYGDQFLNITIAPFQGGAIITSQDITERKKAEEMLRIERDNLTRILESMKDGVYIVNQQYDIEYVNPVLIKEYGQPGKKKCYAYFHDRKKVCPWCQNKAVFAGKTVRWEWYSFKNQKTYDLIDTPIKNPDGSVSKLEMFRDITERKRAEEAEQRSEGKYRSLFDNMREGFAYCKIIIDKNNKPVDFEYIEVNDAFEILTGLKKEDITGKKVTEAIPGIKKENPELFEIYGKVALTGKATHFDIYFKPLKIWLSLSVYCPKKGYFVAVFDNISERKKAEEELKQSEEQLRDLTAHLQSIREQERTLIAREMHDELGQSLTALKMDLSWLDRKTPKDQKPLVDRIISMRKLIDSTLQTVKRISTELRPELLDDLGLSAAIEWQGEEFQNRTGIKTEVTMDPEEIILDQDCSTAIFRIFQEALTNVARHANATRVTVKLKIKANKLELRVKDNGKGITEKQISGPKSFGLIGIQERVHFLGGEVNIRGVQDKGTTVTVRIPIPKEGKAG